MPFHTRCADATPAEEEQEGRPLRTGVVDLIDAELDRIRKSVAALERRRSAVHKGVSADGVGVAQTVVRREMLPTHGFTLRPRTSCTDHALRRPPTQSLTTLPAMNAMFAGRSARRRIRYGYHCVPNGT